MSERRFGFERTVAFGLAVLVGSAALAGCTSYTVGADQGPASTASTEAAPQSPPDSSAYSPDVIDVGKLRKQMERVPAAIIRAEASVLRVQGESCNDGGCINGYDGTTFGVEVNGARYQVTAGHAEKVPFLSCKDQYLEGWANGRTFRDRVTNRAGTYKVEPGTVDNIDYSVPDLGMFRPAASAAISSLGTLSLAPSDKSLEPGQVVYAVGYHPNQKEISDPTFPPPEHPALHRTKNLIGGIVIGPLEGSVGATAILEIMGGVEQGDSGGPLMTPDATVGGVNSSVSDPQTPAQIEQDLGLHLVDFPRGQEFSVLYVQNVNTASAAQLVSSMRTPAAC